MRALEVAVYMSNSSMEDVVRSNALTRERGEMAEMEAKVVVTKAENSEKDNMIAILKKKSDLASRYSDELREARAQFAAEKKALEDALYDASFPGEDKTEDKAERARLALVYRIEELERNLVGAVRHGFHNAVDQLKVVNPGVEFYTDRIHFLRYVRNGEIVAQDDDGHV